MSIRLGVESGLDRLARFRPGLSSLARFRRPGPGARRVATVLAISLFVAMVIWGVDGYRQSGLTVRVELLVLAAVVGTPLALALNTIELRLIGRAAGVELSSREATTTTLFASAANFLPLPGSVLVRGWSLTRKGASLGDVVRVQAQAGVTFVAVSLALTGPLIATATPVVGLLVWLVGVVATAALLVTGPPHLRRLMVVEGAVVASELARFSLVLVALGVEVTMARAAGLVAANVLAMAIGVFPAGLGIREALAALSATVTMMSSTVAVTVSVADRVATSIVLALFLLTAVVLGLRPARQPTQQGQIAGPDLETAPS